MATDRQRERRLKGERSRRARALPRIQKDTAAEVGRILGRAERDIRATLAGAPSDYQAWALPSLQASVRDALDSLGADAGQAMAEGATRAWDAGIDTVDAPVNAAMRLDAPDFRIAAVLPEVDTRQLLAMRSFLTAKMKDVSTTLAERVNTELGLTMIGTRSVGETTGRVAAILKTGGRSRALTIVRTELGRAYSMAGQQRMEQAAGILPGLRKQWRRSGKLRSRIAHDAVDGQTREAARPFDVGGASLMYPRDPAGPAAETINCGCQSLPWMESWEVENPGRKPFSDEEIARDPRRADLEGKEAGAGTTPAS